MKEKMTDQEKLVLFRKWRKIAEREGETHIATALFDRILDIKHARLRKGTQR
jgi:hypothetical protein